MVLHMVDLVNSHEAFYGDCPVNNYISQTGIEDLNMNSCLSAGTLLPGLFQSFILKSDG